MKPVARILAAEAVALDLDGTLLDTAADLAAAANFMLARLSLATLPEAAITDFIGDGMASLVARALQAALGADPDPALQARGSRLFEKCYAAHLDIHTRPYPGVVEALATLADKGLPLGCVTNKSRRFTVPLLERAGVARFLTATVCGGDVPRKKPAPDLLLHAARLLGVAPSALVMVGDSANDILAARAAGCPVVLVSYGYRGGAAAETLGADQVVDDLAAWSHTLRRADGQCPPLALNGTRP